MAEPVVCSGTCTVTVTVDTAPMTEEKALDLVDMFWSFVLCAVLVWGSKALLRIFTHDTDN